MAKKRIFGANKHCRQRLKKLLDFFDLETIHYNDEGRAEEFTMTRKDGKRIKLRAQKDGMYEVWLTVDVLPPVTSKP